MKTESHPTYFPEAKVTCGSCGETWTTGSTQEELRVELCSNCHPFYTGEQRIVDTEGQVDRFYKRLEARTNFVKGKEDKAAAKVSPDRLLADLELGKRTLDAYKKGGIENAGQFMDKLEEGEKTLLEMEGIGRKSLADVKKALRRLGYDIPEAETAK
jgi:large subunit ribosomal protein L31